MLTWQTMKRPMLACHLQVGQGASQLSASDIATLLSSTARFSTRPDPQVLSALVGVLVANDGAALATAPVADCARLLPLLWLNGVRPGAEVVGAVVGRVSGAVGQVPLDLVLDMMQVGGGGWVGGCEQCWM